MSTVIMEMLVCRVDDLTLSSGTFAFRFAINFQSSRPAVSVAVFLLDFVLWPLCTCLRSPSLALAQTLQVAKNSWTSLAFRISSVPLLTDSWKSQIILIPAGSIPSSMALILSFASIPLFPLIHFSYCSSILIRVRGPLGPFEKPLSRRTLPRLGPLLEPLSVQKPLGPLTFTWQS
jgi:hypothetical protein